MMADGYSLANWFYMHIIAWCKCNTTLEQTRQFEHGTAYNLGMRGGDREGGRDGGGRREE